MKFHKNFMTSLVNCAKLDTVTAQKYNIKRTPQARAKITYNI
jgi:hypothetical protein